MSRESRWLGRRTNRPRELFILDRLPSKDGSGELTASWTSTPQSFARFGSCEGKRTSYSGRLYDSKGSISRTRHCNPHLLSSARVWVLQQIVPQADGCSRELVSTRDGLHEGIARDWIAEGAVLCLIDVRSSILCQSQVKSIPSEKKHLTPEGCPCTRGTDWPCPVCRALGWALRFLQL